MLTRPVVNRRAVLIAVAGAAAILAGQPARAAGPAIHVVKGRGCGCCTAWADILAGDGFSVTIEEIDPENLDAVMVAAGIPLKYGSCHTARVEGYAIEGHVPVADIRRLLAERPDAVGLAVPGMPMGSPGMGPENEREAYDVLLIARDGSASVFSHYPAA